MNFMNIIFGIEKIVNFVGVGKISLIKEMFCQRQILRFYDSRICSVCAALAELFCKNNTHQ